MPLVGRGAPEAVPWQVGGSPTRPLRTGGMLVLLELGYDKGLLWEGRRNGEVKGSLEEKGSEEGSLRRCTCEGDVCW